VPLPIRLVVVLALLTAPVGAIPQDPDPLSTNLPHDQEATADGDVTILRGAEGLFERVHTPSDVRTARATGHLRTHDFLTRGDTLVVQFHAPNLTRSLADTDGQNLTDRFFRYRNRTRFDFSINSTSHTASGQPARLWLNRTNTRVITDTTNGTVWVVVDTTAASVVSRYGRGDVLQTLDYFEFEAVVEIPLDGDERRVLAGESKFEEKAASVRSPTVRAWSGGDPWTLPQNQTGEFVVNATTSLFPGSNVTITAITPNGMVLAEQQAQTTDATAPGVPDDASTLRTTLRIGTLSTDESFVLRLTSGNESIFERYVAVGDPARMWNTSARLLDSGPHAGEVRVSTTVHLPEKGFLEVGSGDDRAIRRIPEDETVRVTVYVARSATFGDGDVWVSAVLDRDGDGEFDNDDTTYSTTADLRATDESEETDRLGVYYPVANWSPPSPTPTPKEDWATALTESPTVSPIATSTTPTQTATVTDTTVGTSGFGFGLSLVGIFVCLLALGTRVE
jgi:hypothetical protein